MRLLILLVALAGCGESLDMTGFQPVYTTYTPMGGNVWKYQQPIRCTSIAPYGMVCT